MWSVARFTAAASLPACGALHQHAPAVVTKVPPTRVKLDNVDDVMFTTKVIVSGEEVHPIMDTGSFELVLFEHGCAGCSGDTTYFNRKKADKDFQDIGMEAQQSYGSGTAYSSALQSGVLLDSLHAGNQMFWLAHDLYLNMYLDDSFGGIFGLGPPASALAFAVKALQASEGWVNDLHGIEQDQYQPVLDSMRQAVKLAEKKKPWLDTIGIRRFSICLLPGAGNSGVLVLHDRAPHSHMWVPVHGEFWQIDMARTSIGGTKASACAAIMDSGTSLIGAPPDFLESVEEMVYDFELKYGCEDLSQWPSFELLLQGGQTLTLDPSSYVAHFDMSSQLEEQDDSTAQALAERARKLMPHLDRASQRLRTLGGSSLVCAAAMFSIDSALGESDGCQFLFGLPIFREYYIMHKIRKHGAPGFMAFTKADSDCTLTNQTDMQTARKSAVPLKIDPKKIRIPSLGLNGLRP